MGRGECIDRWMMKVEGSTTHPTYSSTYKANPEKAVSFEGKFIYNTSQMEVSLQGVCMPNKVKELVVNEVKNHINNLEEVVMSALHKHHLEIDEGSLQELILETFYEEVDKSRPRFC